MILYSVYQKYGKDPFDLMKDTITVSDPDLLKKDGVLLLNGGADISPSIYNQKANKYCHADDKLTQRDIIEILMVDRAQKLGIPIIGICRGAQMLCAIDGGHLIQHIEEHINGAHNIIDTRTGETLTSNSCHHQMMVPNKYNITLAVADTSTKGYDENDNSITIKAVPEVVYFPRFKALGIQGHPEWMAKSSFTKYCADLIKEFLLKE